MKKVYLCGPINGRTDADCRNWRSQAKALLAPLETLDPMARDYRGRETESGVPKIIVEQDKADIDDCDALLVLFDRPSVGAAMEIMYARTPLFTRDGFSPKRLPVFVVDMSGRPLSPWLSYHATAVFPSLDAACSAVLSNYGPRCFSCDGRYCEGAAFGCYLKAKGVL